MGEVKRVLLVEVFWITQDVANAGGRAGIVKLGWLGGSRAGERGRD